MGTHLKISTSILIDATADRVWEIIGPGFGRVSDWVSAIDFSEPVGAPGPNGSPTAGRSCRVATTGFDQIAEELTEYDPVARRVSYRIAGGMPSFVIDAGNTWQARSLGDGRTQFTMDAEATLSGAGRLAAPLLRLYLSRVGRRTGRDLKMLLETGWPSRSKTIQTHATRRTLLDRLVAANAVFSASSGAALTVAGGWWSRQLGGPGAEVIAAIGMSLVGYAVLLGWMAGRGATGEQGRFIAALDAAWVTGTVTVVATSGAAFTGLGITAAVLTGLVVAELGLLQWRAASRLNRPEVAPRQPVDHASAVVAEVSAR